MQINKLKFYQWATWILIILNISMVYFLVFTKPKHPDNANIIDSVKREMLLTEEQENLFLTSADTHREHIEEINDNLQLLWQSYFKNLTSTDSLLSNDTLITDLQNLESKKIEITNLHFQEIKSFLKPSQYKGFSVFQQRLIIRNYRKGKDPRP